MIGSPYFLFMAEAEGKTDLVDTRAAKLNKAVKIAKEMKEGTAEERFYTACRQLDLLPLAFNEEAKIFDI